MTHPRITFIGAGNMATSLIGGLLAQGIPASHIRASDPGAEQRAKVAAEFGIELFESNAEAIAGADVVVLATKPQVLKGVSQALAPSLQPGQLIVSIAAGITCASLASWLGDVAIVRCMPNTPALLRQGVSGLYANAKVSAAQRQQAEQLLSAVGLALWLDEEQLIDAVTAVSGSGPAYFFLLIEAMTAAGGGRPMLTGSGSACFALARSEPEAQAIAARLEAAAWPGVFAVRVVSDSASQIC